MRAMATPSLSLPDYDSTPRLGTVGAIVKRRAGNRRIDHHGVSSRGIRPAFSGLSFVPWGLVRNISRSPALKCWAIFKHGQARRQSVLGLGRAFCAGREVTNTPGATEWYRAARAKPERVWKSPSISAVGARQGAVRSLMKFEPVPRKKLEVLLKSSVCDPFRETRGIGGVPQVCLLRLMSVAPKSN